MENKPVGQNHVRVNRRICHVCGACVAVCPHNALFLWNGALEVIENACSGCLRCVQACPMAALYPASQTPENITR